MTDTPTVDERLAQLFAKTTTETLIASLRTLDAGPRSLERNWARSQTIQELERRHPRASDAVGDAFLAAEERMLAGGPPEEVDYVAVLLAAIEQEGTNG